MAVDAGTIYSDVRVRLDKLTGDIAGIKAQFDRIPQAAQQAQTKTDSSEQKMESGFKNLNLAAIAAMAGITVAIKSVVSTFASFEQSMANTQSVTGATSDEFAAMTAKAEEMGKTTRFTASQAGDAMYYLASAGMNAQQIMDSLNGVMTLAGATQSDLASTSATVAATLSQFSLKAGESTRVANVFAAAITSSQATMSKLSDAMRYAGPIAGGMGKSLEETTAALDALFNAGFEASQAGTTLREVLGYLSDSTGPVVKRLEELGISFDQVNPITNSLADVIDRLNQAGLTAADAMSIFGQRAGPGLQILLKTGGDELRAMQDKITGTQKASEAYAIQLDTLAGDTDIMKSAAQEAAITFGKAFEPSIRMVERALSAVLNFVSSFPAFMKIMIGAVVAAAAAMSGLSIAAGVLGTTLSIGILGPVGLAIAGVIGLTAGIAALSDQANKARINNLFTQATEDLRQAVANGLDVKDAIKQVADETGLAVSKVADLATQAGLVSDAMQKQVDALVKANALTDQQKQNTAKIAKDNETMKDLLGTAANSMGNMADIVKNASEQWGISETRVLAIAKTLDNLTPAQKDQLKALEDQNAAIKKMLEDLGHVDESYQQRSQDDAGRLSALKKQTDEIVQQQKLEQQAADKEKARLEGVVKARNDAVNKYNQSLSDTLALEKEGLISHTDAMNEQLQANSQLIDSLRTIGYASEEDGKIGYAALVASYARQKELEKAIADSKAAQDAFASSIHTTAPYLKDLGDQFKSANQDAVQFYISQLPLHDQKIAAINQEADRLRAAGVDEVAIQQWVTDQKIKLAQDETKAKQAELDKQIQSVNYWGRTVIDIASQAVAAIASLYEAQYNAQIAALDAQTQAQVDAISAQEQGLDQSSERYKQLEAEKTKVQKDEATKRAQLQYKVDLAQWNAQLLQAIATGAEAILQTLASVPFPFNIPLAVAEGVVTGVQIAAVANAKPKPPALATGGIVLPSDGGSVVRVAENNNPELILNGGPSGDALLQRFADQIANALGGSGGRIVVQTVLDGKIVAESTARYFNNGKVRLSA